MRTNKFFVNIFITVLCAQLSAQTPKETYIKWAEETLGQIERDFKANNGALYLESINSHPAFAWPMGIQMHALIAAGKIDKAEALVNEFHQRYWCFMNGIWGYNAVVDGCGDRYYDDNAWIAKALMELYAKTNDTTYLNRAKKVIAFSMSGENGPEDAAKGGISFHENQDKVYSICATAPTTVANLMVYMATGEEQYKTDGERLYHWMKSQGWGLGYGYRGYENGVQTQAAILMFRATGDSVYYSDAKYLANAMETVYINRQTRALNETGQWGGHDMTNAYVDLYELDGNPEWLNIAGGYLTYLHNVCKDDNGRYPEYWNTTNDVKSFLLYQASAARAYARMSNTPGGVPKLTEPVIIYADASFVGRSSGFSIGQYKNSDILAMGFPDNQVSSVRVFPGYRAILFKGDNFTGDSLVLDIRANSIGDFSDKVKSIKVEILTPGVVVFEKCTFGGKAVNLPAREYTLADLYARGIGKSGISSLKISNGYRVVLYKNDAFTGDSLILNEDNICLDDIAWNDSARSIKISCSAPIAQYVSINNGEPTEKPTIELYTGDNIKFSPSLENNEGSWYWSGPNLMGTNREFSLYNLKVIQNGTYHVYHTDNNGCTNSAEYKLSVNPYRASLYTECGFEGEEAEFMEGSHSMFVLNSKGIPNDAASAIKVAPGFELVAYEDYNFTGQSFIFTENDTCLTDNGIDNWISSIKVRKATVPVSNIADKAYSNIDIYPNPANRELSIRNSHVDITGFSIYNYQGTEIMRSSTCLPSIDISALNPGMYLLVLRADNKLITRKFIKE
ncbi:MAG: T9SS type A sorting domain-containing protein [Bacteroidales bacterium]|nr:T9SS type A sorting domain-containing protein [Bacteroidales bacterium]